MSATQETVSSAAEPGLVPMLDHALLAEVESAMRQAIEPMTSETKPLYGWLTYHLGWTDIDGQLLPARRGKGMRPTVCLIACGAVGGEPRRAVPAAAALELTHQFSLIHDDIEDGDRIRRGRPALWAVIGVEQAINAGDAMWAVARQVLLTTAVPDRTLIEMVRRYDAACRLLTEGQYLDLSFESRASVSPEAYLDMASRKTGALFSAAAALGALVGGGPSPAVEAMATYGKALGIAFQVRDDILGLWEAEATTGKPLASDLRRGKKSLPIVMALAHPELGEVVSDFLAAEERSPEKAAALATAMASAGVRQQTELEAQRWAEAAIAALERVPLAAHPRALLESLVWQAVRRPH